MSRPRRGKTYDLTVIPRGNRIEIPELATIFVRCKPGDQFGARVCIG